MNEPLIQEPQLTDDERAFLKEVMDEIADKKEVPRLTQEKLKKFEVIRKKLEIQQEPSLDVEKAKKIHRAISTIGKSAAFGAGASIVVGAFTGFLINPFVGTIVGAAIGSVIARNSIKEQIMEDNLKQEKVSRKRLDGNPKF